MQTIQSQHYDGAPQEKSKAKSKKQKAKKPTLFGEVQ